VSGTVKVHCGASAPGLLIGGYLPPVELLGELCRMEMMIHEAREAALENLLR